MPSSGIAITSDDRGPWVNILSWILMVAMIIASFVKLTCKWIAIRNFALDDIFMVSAMMFTMGYDVAASFQVAAGLGKHQTALSNSDLLRYQKASYVSQIFLIISLGVAKVVLLQFFLSLGHRDVKRRIIQGVMSYTIIAYAVMLFPAIFQCPAPKTWEILSPKCSNQAAFWSAFTAIDVSTDCCTVCLPIYLLYNIKLNRSQKIYTICAFSARALLIPISIARMVYIKKYSKAIDQSYDNFAEVMITSLLINGSIIITAVPFLKPIMDGLQTGILTSDLRSMTGPTIFRSTSYPLESLSKNKQTKNDPSNTWRMGKGMGHSVTTASFANDHHWRMNHGSGGSNERMVIQQETTVSVQYGENT